MAPKPLFNTGGLTIHLPFPSLPQTCTNAMVQNDHLPLVFKFGEVDSEPEEIENKEEWGLMDMAQNKLAAAVAAPAPVPAPIPAPAPVPAIIPVALTGWSPSTIAELEAAGVSEVSADPRELVYMPAPAPVPVLMRAPPPTVAPAPVRLAAPAAPVPVRAPPSVAWDAAVDRYLSAAPISILPCPARRSRDDMMFDLQVKNILCCLEDFNNRVPEDDNDKDSTAGSLRRHWK